jgi:hypothetical protein
MSEINVQWELHESKLNSPNKLYFRQKMLISIRILCVITEIKVHSDNHVLPSV